MKVIHVVRQFSPSIGGLEEAVMKLCGALRAKGVATSVVTLDRIANGTGERLAAAETIAGIDVRRIPFRGSWRYPVAPGVLACLGEADVVHVHGIDFFFDFLALTRSIHRKTLVASTHGGFFHTAFANLLKQIYFRTITRASLQAYSALCASSESDLDLFRPIADDRLVLVANGVDVDKWSALASPQPVRSLLYIGRFSSNKNLAVLFRLLRRLRDLHPDWSLTIAGRPWDVSVGELEQEAARHGVTSAVRLIVNPSDAEIADAVRASTYIVSASRHEGFGLSIVEGMSAGLIPVVNRIPAFTALVAVAGCGVEVDFSEADITAAIIERLHHTVIDQPLRVRHAAMDAARSFSWDGAATLFLQQYENALRGAQGVPRPIPLSHS